MRSDRRILQEAMTASYLPRTVTTMPFIMPVSPIGSEMSTTPVFQESDLTTTGKERPSQGATCGISDRRRVRGAYTRRKIGDCRMSIAKLQTSKQIHTVSPIMLKGRLTLAVLGICPHIVGPGLEQQRSLLRGLNGNLRVQTKNIKNTHAHTHTFTIVREVKMGASARKEANAPYSILGAAPIHISIPLIPEY
jgi:hypothetical protein